MSKTDKAPAFLKKAKKPEVAADKLDQVKALVKKYRDETFEANQIATSLSEKQAILNRLKKEEIPSLMEKFGIPSITVEAEGNYPAFTAERKPFYSAGISADWPEEKKQEAYDYLESIGEGDLITNEVSYRFPREYQPAVAQFIREVQKIKLMILPKGKKKKERLSVPPPEVSKGVHSGTLKKWLRERVESDGKMPKLDKIGGFVGVVAEVKEVKEKKPRPNRPEV